MIVAMSGRLGSGVCVCLPGCVPALCLPFLTVSLWRAVSEYKVEGSDLLGRRIVKEFDGITYLGVVVSWMPPCPEEDALYHAVYHDGDEEDLEVSELAELLVPLDCEATTPQRLVHREKDLECHAASWKSRWRRHVPRLSPCPG